jgi:hypothetical protein
MVRERIKRALVDLGYAPTTHGSDDDGNGGKAT